MLVRASLFVPVAMVLVCLGGCSSLLRDPVRGTMSGHVDMPADLAVGSDEGHPSGSGPVTRWAERQRFIFERAWREIREDLAYERIDSFANLDGRARRDVMAMRDDMASDRGAVTTAGRRKAVPEAAHDD